MQGFSKITRAHATFHAHHTLDSTRVRWGVQAYQKKKEKERKEKKKMPAMQLKN